MATRFTQLESARVDSLQAAERVRRSHQIAIEELRAEVRRLDGRPRMVGVCMATMSADQAVTTAGDVIDLDTKSGSTVDGLVALSTSSGQFSLSPGYTYVLRCALEPQDSGGYMKHQWYNVTDSAWIGAIAIGVAADRSSAATAQPVAVAILTPAATTKVEVRVEEIFGATTVVAENAWATVEVFQP